MAHNDPSDQSVDTAEVGVAKSRSDDDSPSSQEKDASGDASSSERQGLLGNFLVGIAIALGSLLLIIAAPNLLKRPAEDPVIQVGMGIVLALILVLVFYRPLAKKSRVGQPFIDFYRCAVDVLFADSFW